VPALAGVQVEGLAELRRALSRLSTEAGRAFRAELADLGKDIAMDASTRAVDEIRNIGDRWSEFRVGVTAREVYVVPRERAVGRGSARKRPNLAGMLMTRALEPAMVENEVYVEQRLNEILETLIIKNHLH
jgi:hypothetical protein